MMVDKGVMDPLATALSAIENASARPISIAEIPVLLGQGVGEASHLRALFGDVDLHTLVRLAARFDIDGETLARAYRRAKREAAAANGELDEFAAQYFPVNAPRRQT